MGATKNNTGGHLKIRGAWEKFKYKGAYKIFLGFEKIEGQGFHGACYRWGVIKPSFVIVTNAKDKRHASLIPCCFTHWQIYPL